MSLTKSKTREHIHGFLVSCLMKYPKISTILALFCLLCISKWLFKRGNCVHAPKPIPPLFHTNCPVVDIANGSVAVLQSHLKKSSFSFVMYYAHWCAQSISTVKEFLRASKIYEGQVSFIAINCWAGPCRSQNNLNSYPQLFIHHTFYEARPFQGKRKYLDLVSFVARAIRPLTFISTKDILEEFINKATSSIIYFMNVINYNDVNYNEFFGAALHSVTKGSTLHFGVVASTQIASLLGLKMFGDVVLLNPFNVMKFFPDELHFNRTSLLHWAEQNKVQFVEQLDPDVIDAKIFGKMLKLQPSLILFLPLSGKLFNSKILRTYHSVALSYHNCSCVYSKPASNPTDESFRHSYTAVSTRSIGFITSCQSLALKYHQGRQNSCDVCRECRETCSFIHTSFFQQTFSVLRGIALPRNSCRCLRRNSYEQKDSYQVCCYDDQTPNIRSLLNYEKASGENTFDSDRQAQIRILPPHKIDWLLKKQEYYSKKKDTESFRKLLGNLVKTLNTSGTGVGDILEESESVADDVDISYRSEYGTCQYRGKVKHLTGASCYSNTTLKFYFMDSRKLWKLAVSLGVNRNVKSRVALVLVDPIKEIQYVHPEEMTLDNASIVDFVMKFKRGDLTRRLRSAVVPRPLCTSGKACIIEVVSETFNDLVLDDEKNVFLMYYTRWCGFCKSVKPVIMLLADHYKNSPTVRIARINGDVNDLPWQYTVYSYPTFIFFPSRRKQQSVEFPEMEQRSLENFIGFVENHKTVQVSTSRKRLEAHVKIKYLRRNISFLKMQNRNLRMRLMRETVAKRNAENERSKIERLLVEKNTMLSNFQSEQSSLSKKNREMLQEILTARDQLSKYRKLVLATLAELKKRNWELQSTILSLEQTNLINVEDIDASSKDDS